MPPLVYKGRVGRGLRYKVGLPEMLGEFVEPSDFMPPLEKQGEGSEGIGGMTLRNNAALRRIRTTPVVSPYLCALGFIKSETRYRESLPSPLNYGMIAPGNHWDSNSLRGAPPLQAREGMACAVNNNLRE